MGIRTGKIVGSLRSCPGQESAAFFAMGYSPQLITFSHHGNHLLTFPGLDTDYSVVIRQLSLFTLILSLSSFCMVLKSVVLLNLSSIITKPCFVTLYIECYRHYVLPVFLSASVQRDNSEVPPA